MAAPEGQVPIVESVRAGLSFVVANIRPLAPIILGAAGAMIAIRLLIGSSLASPGGLLFWFAAQGVLLTLVYTAFLRIALRDLASDSYFNDAARLMGALAITGFFLFIVFLVLLMPGVIALGVALQPYQADMEAAQGDPLRTQAVLAQIWAENPWPSIILVLFYLTLWFLFTSRLYLVAPGTIGDRQIRTFETWPWTRGAMLRIAAARLILLAPISIGLVSVEMGAMQWVAANGPPAQAIGVTLVLLFAIGGFLVLALEAGLSAFLYRGLRPARP